MMKPWLRLLALVLALTLLPLPALSEGGVNWETLKTLDSSTDFESATGRYVIESVNENPAAPSGMPADKRALQITLTLTNTYVLAGFDWPLEDIRLLSRDGAYKPEELVRQGDGEPGSTVDLLFVIPGDSALADYKLVLGDSARSLTGLGREGARAAAEKASAAGGYPEPFLWRGIQLRAILCTDDERLTTVDLSNAGTSFLMMVRFASDEITTAELFAHKNDFSLRNSTGLAISRPFIRANGVVLKETNASEQTCTQFDVIFSKPSSAPIDDAMLSRFSIAVDMGADERVLAPVYIPRRQYALLDDDTPAAERNFLWALARVPGQVDAFTLIHAVCYAEADPAQAYRDALAYADAHGLSQAFFELRQEIAASRLAALPAAAMTAYMSGNGLYQSADQSIWARRQLIDELEIPDAVLEQLRDIEPQFSYPGAIWDASGFSEFYGTTPEAFRAASPRADTYVLTLSPASMGKPVAAYDPADDAHNQNMRKYAKKAAEGLYDIFSGRAFLLTGNPDIASVRLELDVQYVFAGQYSDNGEGLVTAFDTMLTLTAYDTATGGKLAALNASALNSDTIRTDITYGAFWLDAPSLAGADGAEVFVEALTHRTAQPDATIDDAQTAAPDEDENQPAAPEGDAQPAASASKAPSFDRATFTDWLNGGREAPDGEPSDGEPADSPTAQPTTPPEDAGSDQAVIQQTLAALGEPLYDAAYAYLVEGNTIAKGDKSEYARGLQALLAALGRQISVDGAAGSKTFAALNEVQRCLELDETDSVDAACFEQMLICLLSAGDAGEAVLVGPAMTESEYNYLRGCGLELLGNYYKAYAAFTECGSAAGLRRAQACVQPWPHTGEVYRNRAYRSSSVDLYIKIENQTEGHASLAKVYAENGDLVSCVFIAGSGKGLTQLPSGVYTVKIGVGQEWFGVQDAFGRTGFYETMLFEDGERTVRFRSNYEYTLSIHTDERDPDADTVDSEHEYWDNF